MPAAHLTCVGATRGEWTRWRSNTGKPGCHTLSRCAAIRPRGSYRPHPGGYPFAVDLVAGLKRVAPFEISVAAYPEVHPQAQSRMADLDNLKRKLDVGANRAITNFFFDTSVFLRFLDLCLAAGIAAPIVPGIMPVTNLAGLRRMSSLSGGSVPDWLGHMFDGLDDDPETRRMVAAVVAAEQVRLLQANWDRRVPLLYAQPARANLCDRAYPWGCGRERWSKQAAHSTEQHSDHLDQTDNALI